MSIPEIVKKNLKVKLFGYADTLGWLHLSTAEKKKHYEAWTRDTTIGGVLGRFVEQGKVRVYIKDTLLKDYARIKLACDPPRRVPFPRQSSRARRGAEHAKGDKTSAAAPAPVGLT